jgi:hypothetical protein
MVAAVTSIHPTSDKVCSRKLGFRRYVFSQTRLKDRMAIWQEAFPKTFT